MLGTWNFVCSFSVWSCTNLMKRFLKLRFLAILWLDWKTVKKGRLYWTFGHKMATKQNFQNRYVKFKELYTELSIHSCLKFEKCKIIKIEICNTIVHPLLIFSRFRPGATVDHWNCDIKSKKIVNIARICRLVYVCF